jgi:hypothetical protein
MKNKKRLIKANVFALVMVLGILTVYRILGIQIGLHEGAFMANATLLAVPQFGFVYFYWKSILTEGKKAVA